MITAVYQSQPFPVVTYFFQIVPDGPIKIGRSKDVIKRFRDVRGFMPFPVAPLLVVPGDHEQHLHYILRPYRLNGEWFEPNDAIGHLIDELDINAEAILLVDGHRTPVTREYTRVQMASLVRRLVGPRMPKTWQQRRNMRRKIKDRYGDGFAARN